MRLSLYLAPLCASCIVLGSFGISISAQADVAQWLQAEVPVATQGMLANISRPGMAPGSVIAAPSSAPNYYYHWIRDAALTMDVVVSLYQRADFGNKQRYYQILNDYVTFSRRNQLTPNRSGAPDDQGLGEPKFNLDGSAFMGDWGRPQNDGPALRAVTLIRFANILLAQGNSAYVRQYLYDGGLPSKTVIKNDLEFVAHHWQESSFDLWEEVKGTHFFTRLVQRRALYEGAKLADQLGDSGAAIFYRQQISVLEQQIARHWDSSRGTIVETIDQASGFGKPSGLDSAVIVAALRGSTDDGYMSVTSDQVVASAEKIREVFAGLYSVNRRTTDWNGLQMGTAIGRYPEDTYNGADTRNEGNPWFLLTLAYAEYYHRCATAWQNSGQIRITNLNAPMLNGLKAYTKGALQPGQTIQSSDPRFGALVSALREAGDEEFRRAHFHAGTDGSLWEQFDRNSGYMESAANLTWSYAALLTASEARP